MKTPLTIQELIKEAKKFCEEQSKLNHKTLIGVTDGKAVGTYVERKFKERLEKLYAVTIGNSASAIDLPDPEINTDIKVTSKKQPQSSCPYESPEQKIYGLGYNLLIFVYEKIDKNDECTLKFTNCTFVEKERTADFTTTKRLIEMLKDEAQLEDLVAYFQDRNIPGDDITHNKLAQKVLSNPPKVGYLTISNALQWRLQYSRVISLKNEVAGVHNIDW